MTPEQTGIRNRLLSLQSPDDFRLLAAHLEPIDMPRGFLLAAKDEPLSHYYFPESGIGSIIAVSPEGTRAEAGLVGFDGLSPVTAIMGAKTVPYEIVMQIGGDGHRIPVDEFSRIFSERVELRRLVMCFAHTMFIQTAYTALSNAIHQVDERLARWILMCHDRTDGDEIALTHDFLSIMLAVRRPSVTTALHVLEGNRLIVSERGLITVRDRKGLEAFASDAYGIPEAEYRSIFGPMK